MRSIIRRLALPLLGALWLSSANAALRLDFNDGWRFRIDPDEHGVAAGWPSREPSDTERVVLPHTWAKGKHADYEGTAWYFKSFRAGEEFKGKHVELNFGATFYKARIWLNGRLVGEHEGGYTAYHLDLTPYLKAENHLAVSIDNVPRADSIPGKALKGSPTSHIYDWWPFGGIVRDTWLTVSDRVVGRFQHIDSTVADGAASIDDRIHLENLKTDAAPTEVEVAVFAADSATPLLTEHRRVTLAPGVQDVNVHLHLASPHLWRLGDPYLYRMVTTVTAADGTVQATLTDDFGIRTVTIHDRHLYLNGERVRLSGLTRHEDSPWEGLAETRGTIWHDYDDMKSLHMTLTRPVHYPQHPLVYDYADRNGILLIPEVPMWQFSEAQMTNPKVVALAKKMMTELIEQNYNHPSIFAWSAENESDTGTDGGIAYFKTMYALAKHLDPHRFVTLADDQLAFIKDPTKNASSLADFVMWNQYFGTWDAPESLLPAAFDFVEKAYPDKMVIISEFGVPGIYATNPTTADKFRVEIIERQMAMFAARDWIAGAIFWCYEDYPSSHNLRPGQDDHYVDHGLVDKDRQRKPSYFAWQRAAEPAHLRVLWHYDAKGTPNGFEARVARRSEAELPSLPLEGYHLEWRITDATGAVLKQGTQALKAPVDEALARVDFEVPDARRVHLLLRLVDGLERATMTRSITWHPDVEGAYDGSATE